MPSYTADEKLQIAKRFLVPRQLDEHGLHRKQVKVPEGTLRRLITDYTHEAGVRQLDREIASLARKAAKKIISHETGNGAIVIAEKELTDYLGQPRFLSEKAERITDFGIAMGLAWTPVGGEILFIEATRMPGKGKLLLTGSLGDVMKESAQTALSYLRSQLKRLKIDPKEFDVHVPAGATPKDGPSAGTPLLVALASVFMRRLVRSDIAMTGEISLRGRILRVGGIKEKVLAAVRTGVKEVVLPEENRNDWLELPDDVRQKIKATFVRKVADLLPHVFKK